MFPPMSAPAGYRAIHVDIEGTVDVYPVAFFQYCVDSRVGYKNEESEYRYVPFGTVGVAIEPLDTGNLFVAFAAPGEEVNEALAKVAFDKDAHIEYLLKKRHESLDSLVEKTLEADPGDICFCGRHMKGSCPCREKTSL